MQENFYIDLDLTGLESQIDDVHRSYTDLGAAIRQVTRDSTVVLADMAGKSTMTVTPMADVPPTLETSLDQLARHIAELRRTIPTVGAALKQLEEFHAKQQAAALSPAEKAASMVPPGLPDTDKIRALAEHAQNNATKVMEEVRKAIDDSVSWGDRIRKVIDTELKNARAKISGILRSLPKGIASGFLGGLMGMAVLGYTERTRRAAEMGEMANVFEGGVNSLFSKGTRDAVQWFANWGEKAQFFWGVGRKETQGALKIMVDTGFETSEMSRKYGKGLGDVGENVVTLALGLGKHYNFDTADSMEDIVSLVRDYGMSLNESADLMVQLHSAGERSGVGVRNFVNIVRAAGDPLAQLGISGKAVGSIVEKLINTYESMGIDSRYAGREIEQVAVDMMTAFSRIDDKMKIALARDMYKDPEGDAMVMLSRWEDGLRRVAAKENVTFLDDMLRSFFNVVVRRATVERSSAILLIQGSLGVNSLTAARMYDYVELLEKGEDLSETGKKTREELRNAFTVEGEQVSELFKTKRELIIGAGKIGEGILALIVDMVSMAIMGIQSMASMASAPKGRQEVVSLLVYFKQLEIYRNMGKDLETIKQGVILAKDALPQEFADTFQPVVDALSEDVFINPHYNEALAHPIENLKKVFGFTDKVQPWNAFSQSGLTASTEPGSISALDLLAGDFLGVGPSTAERLIEAKHKLVEKKGKAKKSSADKPRSDQADSAGTPKSNPRGPEMSMQDLGQALLQQRMAASLETSNHMFSK